MRKPQFTPGPWRHFPNGYISDASDDILAELFHATNKPWQEDANLIAAAPELYTALAGLVRACAFFGKDSPTYAKAMEEAEQALTKAEATS